MGFTTAACKSICLCPDSGPRSECILRRKTLLIFWLRGTSLIGEYAFLHKVRLSHILDKGGYCTDEGMNCCELPDSARLVVNDEAEMLHSDEIYQFEAIVNTDNRYQRFRLGEA